MLIIVTIFEPMKLLTIFPKSISFLSDHTTVELVEEIKNKNLKERMGEYRYTVVNPLGHLKNSSVSLGLVQIQRLLDAKLITIEI